jgi:hypothetical protein
MVKVQADVAATATTTRPTSDGTTVQTLASLTGKRKMNTCLFHRASNNEDLDGDHFLGSGDGSFNAAARCGSRDG